MREAKRRLPALAAVLAGGLLLGWLLHRLQTPPDGPVPVAWDRIACERCRMLVGDPAFAAQLHTPTGVLHFDDPGCLLLYVHESRPEVRAVWFHAHGGDDWLPAQRVRFARVDGSPMGYGLGAEPPDAGSLSYAEALDYVLAREAERRDG